MMDPFTMAGWIVCGFTTAAAVYERIRNGNKDRAHEVLAVLTTERDAWKSMAETSKTELSNYREETHTKTDKVNTKLLELTKENAELKASTNLTPVLEFTKEQSQINVKVLTSLDLILSRLQTIEDKAKTKPKLKIRK